MDRCNATCDRPMNSFVKTRLVTALTSKAREGSGWFPTALSSSAAAVASHAVHCSAHQTLLNLPMVSAHFWHWMCPSVHTPLPPCPPSTDCTDLCHGGLRRCCCCGCHCLDCHRTTPACSCCTHATCGCWRQSICNQSVCVAVGQPAEVRAGPGNWLQRQHVKCTDLPTALRY